jgi:hypothetical protein
MIETFQEFQRYRGFVLTRAGRQKIQDYIQKSELSTGIHFGARAIAERVQLFDSSGIHPITVRKILRGQEGVDKRSIQLVFSALQLSLEVGDFAHAKLYSEMISNSPDQPA